MARPKKETVDYFPHQCIHKKTMFIIESRYGNDGYAFWFKILELLGSSEGHVYDTRNPADWQFLCAKTRLEEGFCIQILNTLAELEAIDQPLWGHGLIWSDNFVQGVSEVYKRRGVEIPQKPPVPEPETRPTPPFPTQKLNTTDVSSNQNRQSRVEESRVEEIGSAGASPPPKDFHFKNKTPWPKDFHLTPPMTDYGKRYGMPIQDLSIEFEKFKSHHQKVESKFNDWVAAWRTWVLKWREIKKPDEPEPGPKQKPPPGSNGRCTKCGEQHHGRVDPDSGLCTKCYGVTGMPDGLKKAVEKAFPGIPDGDEQERINELARQAATLGGDDEQEQEELPFT